MHFTKPTKQENDFKSIRIHRNIYSNELSPNQQSLCVFGATWRALRQWLLDIHEILVCILL